MPLISIDRNRLLKAVQLAVLDLEEGHAPDPFRFADYNLAHPNFLDRLAANLQRGLLRPSPLLEMTFPKSEFAVRPGRRIEIEDLTILYYCILMLSQDLEDKLRPGVVAYRLRTMTPVRVRQAATLILPKYLRRRLRIIEPWYDAWPSFVRSLRRDYARGKNVVGTSDITSFYEDIDLGVLRSELRTRVSPKRRILANILVEMYQSWCARDIHLIRQNRGLPQGTASSGVVANYYLMSFDDALSRFAVQHSLRWYRYNDDMRIVGARRDDVKRGLRTIGFQLSRLNLIQQGSKTRILIGPSARRDLFDKRPEKIGALIKQVQRRSRLPERSRKAMLRAFDNFLGSLASGDEKKDSTVLSMLYHGFGEIGSDRLLPRWKSDYTREPTRARSILQYVGRFLDRTGQCNSLIGFLKLQRSRATDWELAQFVRCCRRLRHLPPEARNLLSAIAQAKSSNWYVRQQAVLTLGWMGFRAEIRALTRVLFTEWEDEVRRAILTTLFLVSESDEKRLLIQASQDETLKVVRMANYLLALRRDANLALQALKQFRTPNEIFFSDNFWKLYQIRHNQDQNTRTAFVRVVSTTKAHLKGQFCRSHLRTLS
jgi:hypothetical protein